MDDLRDLVAEAVRHVRAAPEDLERTLRRARARQRTRRVVAATTALLIAAGGIGLAWWAFGSKHETTPATPSPGRIVFTTQGPDDMMPLIALMDVDGSHVRILASGLEPAWSPDGSMIAFTRSSEDGSTGVYVMNADGTGERRLTTNPQGEDAGPSWSPDGATIVFSRSTFVSLNPEPVVSAANRDLYTVKLDGGEPTALLGGTRDDFEPAWSPDGSRIAFVRMVDPASDGLKGISQIWTVGPDGSGGERLTSFGGTTWGPSWSPDGSTLAFDDGGNDIFLVGADGRGLRRLELPSGWGEVAESPFGATWSPEGRRIAFAAGGEQGHDIFVVDLDGSNLRRLTGAGAEDNAPSWVAPSRTSATSTPSPDATETATSATPVVADGPVRFYDRRLPNAITCPTGELRPLADQDPRLREAAQTFLEAALLRGPDPRTMWGLMDPSLQALFEYYEEFARQVEEAPFDPDYAKWGVSGYHYSDPQVKAEEPGLPWAFSAWLVAQCDPTTVEALRAPRAWAEVGLYWPRLFDEGLSIGVTQLFFLGRPDGPKLWVVYH